MVHYSAPGKLMIAGEWAVLEGHRCIVAAVNRRVHSVVEPLSGGYISVSLDDFKIQDVRFVWDGKNMNIFKIYQLDAEKLKFTKESIEVALRFLQESGIAFRPFKIRTYGEETTANGKKIGFGSSAAAVVAIIASILGFHGYDASRQEIYKLAAIAHYYAQGKAGSAFDVAASTWGGIIVYRRFDAAWLAGKIESGTKCADIVREQWPGFFVESLGMPTGMQMVVTWTGESASTTKMMEQMAAFKSASRADYNSIFNDIGRAVDDLIKSWKAGEKEGILEALKRNRTLLSQLTIKSKVPIETQQLATLADLAQQSGAVGKLSGAGGGDCGFAVCFSKETASSLAKDFLDSGLYPLDVKIDDGVRNG